LSVLVKNELTGISITNQLKRKAGNTEMIESAYDPRVVFIEDRYWITWCNGYNGPTIGIGYTFDFRIFSMRECLFAF
jgi:beta-1,4-mannooligosaccharide/beta-1,4-mannosyl-N-acetylglucosamine phosphorylase